MPVRRLINAEFKSPTVQDGKQVNVEVRWEATGGADLLLSFNADHFSVTPNKVPLPASNAGTKTFKVTVRKKASSEHCDVDFRFGDDHDQDSVEVT